MIFIIIDQKVICNIARSVIISDDGVFIVGGNAVNGISVNDSGNYLQGTTYISGKGKTIRKGEFSDNSRSPRLHTYRETVMMETIPAEVMSQAAGQAGINSQIGSDALNTSVGMDGMMNIMTDLGGVPPHIHSISMKHTHRIEPAYLYRMPSIIGFLSNCISSLSGFFNA